MRLVRAQIKASLPLVPNPPLNSECNAYWYSSPNDLPQIQRVFAMRRDDQWRIQAAAVTNSTDLMVWNGPHDRITWPINRWLYQYDDQLWIRTDAEFLLTVNILVEVDVGGLLGGLLGPLLPPLLGSLGLKL